MKKWIIISDYDANDSFYVEGKTAEEAAFAALEELGWGVAECPEDRAEDHDNDYKHGEQGCD